MEPNERSINEYSKLVDSLSKVAQQIGLHAHGAAIIPPPLDSDAPVVLQVSFSIGEKAEFEQHDEDLDREFKDLIQGATEAERDNDFDRIKKEIEGGDYL